MINRDYELESCIRNGEDCNFIKKGYTDTEITAQQIRKLLLDPDIHNVRVEGALISGTLDLCDTLSAKKPPIGGLELIGCVFLEPIHLERSHLTYLSLLKSAFTELHAQNCCIEGHIDLGYTFSREEPESRPIFNGDNSDFFNSVFTKIPEKERTGLNGPEKWWEYETAINTELDPKDYQSRGRCFVNLSGASVSGSLYLDGSRLVAPAIEEIEKKKRQKDNETINDPSRAAVNLANTKIRGDCCVTNFSRSHYLIESNISGSFLGRFAGNNIILEGDFWGVGGVYWGYFRDAINFQGARFSGHVSFNKNDITHLAVIRGTLNLLSARIENWLQLTGLHCLHSVFCLSDIKDNKNNLLINLFTSTVGNNFWLELEYKKYKNLTQIINIGFLKIGGSILVDINSDNENNQLNSDLLIMNSIEVNGEFKLIGDIGSTIFANNMHVNGFCSIDNRAIFKEKAELIDFKVEGDFEFYPTIHKKVDLTGLHVKGSLYLSEDIEDIVSNTEKNNKRKQDKEFKSLSFVQGISFEDRRKFLDLQTDMDEFLNNCFNQPECGLILKHAVIGKELRIHRLQTDLGDTDTDLINWKERAREFCRMRIRSLTSICEKYLPNSFVKNKLLQRVKNRINKLYGTSSKQISIVQFSDELSFYPGFYWIRCYVEQTIYDRQAGGLIECLWFPGEERIYVIGNDKNVIEEINKNKKLQLEKEEQVKDYLSFFNECIWEDTQPFHIYEKAHEIDRPQIKNLCKKIQIRKIKDRKNKTTWIARTHTLHDNQILKLTFQIYEDGQVQKRERKRKKIQLQTRDTDFIKFSQYYRHANSKELTLCAVRPIASNLTFNDYVVDSKLHKFEWLKRISHNLLPHTPNNSKLLEISLLKKKFKEPKIVSDFPEPPVFNLSNIIPRYCSDKELSFYPGFFWIRFYVEQAFHDAMGGGLIDCLWNKSEQKIVILGGRSNPIHKLNAEKGRLKLETENQAKDYLRFFCECIWGEDGPFHIYEEFCKKTDKSATRKYCKEIRIKEEKDYWSAEAHILYAGIVFEAIFHVNKNNGMIDMVNDRPVHDSGVYNKWKFLVPYRYGINKNSTLNAARSMKLMSHEIQENSNTLANLKPNILKILFSTEIDKLPKPKKNDFFLWPAFLASFYRKTFYDHTGRYRRWLDRFGLFLLQRLPVIDLRGMHAEALNDRRGNGWRDPEALDQLDLKDWLNYKVFLRLEGSSFNRIIYPLEGKTQYKKKDILKIHFNRNREGISSSGTSLTSLNDQNWKSRIGWLYCQYPRGVPGRKTFHQQPFTQLIKAYRSRGDISNLQGILKSIIHIEFMLLAERVTPFFLSTFSIIAFSVFMLSNYFGEDSFNASNSVLPVVFGFVCGAVGILAFCRRNEAPLRNIFLIVLLAAWFSAYLLLESLFFHPTPATVIGIQFLFFSIILWGLAGKLFIYCLQFFYWVGFGYGLSLPNAFLTIIIFLFIGAWGVDKANNLGYLVLDAEYVATQLMDNESQPRFIQIKPSLEDLSMQNIDSHQTLPKCGNTIDPLIYAADIFIPLIDFRQEFRCHIRNTVDGDKKNDWNKLLEATTWFGDEGRSGRLMNALKHHPQTWLWLKGSYTILGWIVISLCILTATRIIRNNSGDSQNNT